MWNPQKNKNLMALAVLVLGVSAAVQAAEPVALESPAEIHGLDIRPVGDGIEVRVLADVPLVWSQYRLADGRLAIDLPNSRVTSGVHALQPIVGLVVEVAVESEDRGSRPLTRLVVTTRDESEHSLESLGNSLVLSFYPQGSSQSLAAVDTSQSEPCLLYTSPSPRDP